MCYTDSNSNSSDTYTDNEQTYNTLSLILNNKTSLLQDRFRALFTLKSLGSDRAIDVISLSFSDHSVLLKHECAYVLGQMGNPYAIPILESILRDTNQDPMVRHEAGEALGAIGDERSINILKEFATHENRVISETCMLSLERISRIIDRNHPDHDATVSQNQFHSFKKNESIPTIPFISIDPSCQETELVTIEHLFNRLVDTTATLYDRYKSMFALRNMNTSEAALAVAKAFDYEKSSSLFRHELAYVLGQMQQESTIPALSQVLAIDSELAMVRHECAEALGAIATPEANDILSKYLYDKDDVVRESCIVALDILEYEQDTSAFQYADGLIKMKEMKEKGIIPQGIVN